MGKPPQPPAVNLAGLAAARLKHSHRAAFLKLLENLCFVDDADAHGEVEPPISALYRLQLLANVIDHEKFDPEGWRRHVAQDPGGAVLLPRSWIIPLLEAFECYRFDESRPTLDKTFGAARSDKHDNARNEVMNLEHYALLAQLIQAERIQAVEKNKIISLEEAKANILERIEGEKAPISERTLDRAWQRWGKLIDKLYAIASNPS